MKNSRGFTLIEIMIVLTILAVVAVTGFSRFNRANNEIRSLERKISDLTKQAHHQARMTNRIYRIVFDMNRSEGGTSSIWVESAQKGILLGQNAFHDGGEEEEEDVDDEEKPKAEF